MTSMQRKLKSLTLRLVVTGEVFIITANHKKFINKQTRCNIIILSLRRFEEDEEEEEDDDQYLEKKNN